MIPIVSPSINFSLEIARACAVASLAAYSKSAEIRNQLMADSSLAGFGPRRFEFIECQATDTQMFVAANDKAITVAMRGTSSPADLIRDCRALPRRVSGNIALHRGFDMATVSILQRALRCIESLRDNKQPIFLTGHSMGGAEVMDLAWRLKMLLPAVPMNVYTFGQPRLGNRAFARAYNEVLGSWTFRVRNREDVIPLVPWLCGYYRHAGKDVLFNGIGAMYQINPSPLLRLAEYLAGLAIEFKVHREKILMLPDHPMKRYIDDLAQATEKETERERKEWRN
jgi:hypothetical protein